MAIGAEGIIDGAVALFSAATGNVPGFLLATGFSLIGAVASSGVESAQQANC